ncbi:MAG: restriction endonuclease [Candidatus Bathyarchaeota archaeon]|nr:restriction endonuclease [Candidatus Bathyarchaeota archaeon]
MQYLAFKGVLKEIIEQYPDIDLLEFLYDKLQISYGKAEELAARIEKEYCRKNIPGESSVRLLVEENRKSEGPSKGNVYSVDCLSDDEFDYFITWLFKELGYEIPPGKCIVDSGVDFVAVKDSEKIAVQVRKWPLSCKVTDSIVLLSEEAKLRHGCKKAIVVAPTYFTQQAITAAQKLSVELWDRTVLDRKIAEAKEKAELEVQFCFPPYEGSLLQSLLRLRATKEFIIEPRAGEKYDIHLPGVKFPLLTFQVRSETVVQCVFRIKDNEPVGELDGEVLIKSRRNKAGPDDLRAYTLIVQYLEQFIE